MRKVDYNDSAVRFNHVNSAVHFGSFAYARARRRKRNAEFYCDSDRAKRVIHVELSDKRTKNFGAFAFIRRVESTAVFAGRDILGSKVAITLKPVRKRIGKFRGNGSAERVVCVYYRRSGQRKQFFFGFTVVLRRPEKIEMVATERRERSDGEIGSAQFVERKGVRGRFDDDDFRTVRFESPQNLVKVVRIRRGERSVFVNSVVIGAVSTDNRRLESGMIQDRLRYIRNGCLAVCSRYRAYGKIVGCIAVKLFGHESERPSGVIDAYKRNRYGYALFGDYRYRAAFFRLDRRKVRVFKREKQIAALNLFRIERYPRNLAVSERSQQFG